MLTIICALAKNRVIGKDNRLIWHIPEDLKRFKALTMGHPIVMGRKTFESLPGVLPGRTHYILTGNRDYVAPAGVICCHSVQELLERLSDTDAFVIGGASVYQLLLPYAKAMELTEIEKEYEGDAYFPIFSKEEWKETAAEAHEGYRFVRYER